MIYAQNPLIELVAMALSIYWYVIIAAVVVSWLIAFNVINTYNQFARTLIRALSALTEPVFRPIRRVIPPVAGLDLSPIVVFLLISWLIYSFLPWLDRHLAF